MIAATLHVPVVIFLLTTSWERSQWW